MKLAISNIAWPASQDEAVAHLLSRRGVAAIEVAPTKVWPAPLEVTDRQVNDYRAWWESRGIWIVAAQALLFGRPDLKLFEGPEARGRTLDYLRGIVCLCARLGAGALVFGSPKNRAVGSTDRAEAWGTAVDFFASLGETAVAEGTAVVIEANPPAYGADFLTRAAEAIELVRTVGHPGIRLHLDAACMAMAGDDVPSTLDAGAPYLNHFHVSEPWLAPIAEASDQHARIAEGLRRIAYPHWHSIETRQAEPFSLDGLDASILRAMAHYGGREEGRPACPRP